jgi:hypothetical protein
MQAIRHRSNRACTDNNLHARGGIGDSQKMLGSPACHAPLKTQRRRAGKTVRSLDYFLYWYKSTNTVYYITLLLKPSSDALEKRYAIYLHYWYKSTNADAEGAAG